MTDRTFYFRAADLTLWSVIDGDTISVVADVGDYDRKRRMLRLNKIDAPELRSHNALERTAAHAVKSWVERWLAWAATKAENVYIASQQKPDKFGRWLGDIQAEAVYLTTALVTARLVRPYHGEQRQAWTDPELSAIIEAAAGPTA